MAVRWVPSKATGVPPTVAGQEPSAQNQVVTSTKRAPAARDAVRSASPSALQTGRSAPDAGAGRARPGWRRTAGCPVCGGAARTTTRRPGATRPARTPSSRACQAGPVLRDERPGGRDVGAGHQHEVGVERGRAGQDALAVEPAAGADRLVGGAERALAAGEHVQPEALRLERRAQTGEPADPDRVAEQDRGARRRPAGRRRSRPRAARRRRGSRRRPTPGRPRPRAPRAAGRAGRRSSWASPARTARCSAGDLGPGVGRRLLRGPAAGQGDQARAARRCWRPPPAAAGGRGRAGRDDEQRAGEHARAARGGAAAARAGAGRRSGCSTSGVGRRGQRQTDTASSSGGSQPGRSGRSASAEDQHGPVPQVERVRDAAQLAGERQRQQPAGAALRRARAAGEDGEGRDDRQQRGRPGEGDRRGDEHDGAQPRCRPARPPTAARAVPRAEPLGPVRRAAPAARRRPARARGPGSRSRRRPARPRDTWTDQARLAARTTPAARVSRLRSTAADRVASSSTTTGQTT